MKMRQTGFTLIEVMIAVTIFVVVAATITETASVRINNLLHLSDKTLASIVAENRITELHLAVQPTVGTSKDNVAMANRDWFLETKVEDTAFPGMRRITVSVSDAEDKQTVLSRLSTIIGQH